MKYNYNFIAFDVYARSPVGERYEPIKGAFPAVSHGICGLRMAEIRPLLGGEHWAVFLAGNRDFCRQQAAEIHPLMSREHCAVFP